MSEIVKTEATLENLAAEINDYHVKCEEAVGQAVSYAMEAGDRLAKVKEGLGHGEWLPWLEKNFKGTPRTAQAYMRVANNRAELEMRSTASHLSIRGALKELSAPREEDDAEEPQGDEDENHRRYIQERRELTRSWMERWKFTVGKNTEVKQKALERALDPEAPIAPHTSRLFHAWGVEDLILIGSQVAVDGWMFEDDADDGTAQISYRVPFGWSSKKEKIVRRSVPITDADEDVDACLKRGAWAIGIAEYRMWRILQDWWARTLAADPEVDVDVWGPAGAESADWRQTDAAADFLTHRAYHPEATWTEYVKKEKLSRHEFKRNLQLVEWMVGEHAESAYRFVTAAPKGGKQKRWEEFETF